MQDLRIIYTPESDKFRLSDIESIGIWNPGDSLLQGLRDNYKRLRQDFPDLPQ